MQDKGNPASARTFVESRGRGQGSIYVRGGGQFEVQYTGSDGKRVFQILRNHNGNAITKITDARTAANTLLGRRDDGKDVRPSKLTFDQVAEMFFESFAARVASGERKQRSLDDYRHRYTLYIKPRVGRINAQQIKRKHALDILDDLRKQGLSTSTLSAVHRTFARIVSFGKGRDLLTVDVALREERIVVENSREVRELTPEEAQNVIEATTGRWRLLVLTAAHTGARVSELLGLTWADFDKEQGTLSITKQLARDGSFCPPKTRNGRRVIQISEGLRKALIGHRVASEHSGDGDFIFAADTELVGRYGLARRAFSRAITKAGISYDSKAERVSLHVFRHTAASRLLNAGFDVTQVAAYLGDRVETIVKVYAHARPPADNANLGEALAS